MGIKEFLNLFRVNIFSSPDNHVLDTPHNVDISFPIHGRQILGVYPSGGINGRFGLFFIVPVAQHYAVTPGTKFSCSP